MSDEQAIGQRIVAFVDQALQGWQQEHAHASDEILADLVASVPAEDPGWTAGIERVAAVVAAALQERPHDWHEALRIIGIYFRSAKVDALSQHPRVDGRFSIGAGAARRRTIRVDLGIPITRLVVLNASTAERQAFFAAIDEWDVLVNLAGALPELDLDAMELCVLLRRADAFTQRDMARGQIFDKVHEWAGVRSPVARQVVDAWLNGQPDYRDLAGSPIAVLVEGVVAADENQLAWRDQVIDSLAGRKDEESWQLAAYLSCFAWPQDRMPDASMRHASLRQHVERLPERMIHVGLNAMQRDAGDYPATAVQTALELMALAPEPHAEKNAAPSIPPAVQRALALLEVACRAIWARKQSTSAPAQPIDWAPVCDRLVPVPPRYTQRLDHFLEDLAGEDPEAARSFLMRWLEAHWRELLAQSNELSHLFPTFMDAAGRQEIARWLVDLAVAPGHEMRAVAVRLLGRDDWIPDHEALSHLSPNQARILAHELAAGGTPGPFWIRALFFLGRSCPDVLPEVRDILLEYAVLDYPGVCRDALALWNTPEPPGDDHGRARAHAREAIVARLDERAALHERKLQVPELLTMLPAMEQARETSQRIQQEAHRRTLASGRFPLLSMLRNVPIARGQGTVHRIDDKVMHVPFAEISGRFEMPFLDSVDPVFATYLSLEHRNQAARLVLQSGGEEGDP